MRTLLATVLVSFLVLHAEAPAQLVAGDLGVTGFIFSGPQAVTVLHAGGTSTVYPLPAVTGLMHAVEFDPTPPGSFLVGGVGHLGRVTIGPGGATYSPISAAVGTVAQMSIDGSDIVVFDSGPSQILRVDASTGAITPLTSGTQPWGGSMTAGCRDPNTGDLFVGGNNAIWRVPAGSSTAIPFASGWAAGSSAVSGLAIDPFSLDVVATLLTVNRVVRISATGVLTDLCPPGAVPGPNAIGIDAAGDVLAAGSFGQTYRIPHAGGSAALVGTAAGIVGAATGVAARVVPFETVLAPVGFGGLSVTVGGIPPGTVAGLTVPSFDVSLSVGGGPIFGFSPDATSFALVLAFPSPAPGNVVHWTWPEPFPSYPAASFLAPPGTLASGTTLDILVVAVNGGGFLRPAPVARVTVN